MCVFVSLCVAYHRPLTIHYSSSFCWVWSIAPTLLLFIVLCSSFTNTYSYTNIRSLSFCHSVAHKYFIFFHSIWHFPLFIFILIHVGVVVVVVVTYVCRVLLKYHMNIKCIHFSLFFREKMKFDSFSSIYFGLVRCFVIECFYRSLFIAVNESAYYSRIKHEPQSALRIWRECFREYCYFMKL